MVAITFLLLAVSGLEAISYGDDDIDESLNLLHQDDDQVIDELRNWHLSRPPPMVTPLNLPNRALARNNYKVCAVLMSKWIIFKELPNDFRVNFSKAKLSTKSSTKMTDSSSRRELAMDGRYLTPWCSNVQETGPDCWWSQVRTITWSCWKPTVKFGRLERVCRGINIQKSSRSTRQVITGGLSSKVRVFTVKVTANGRSDYRQA